MCVVRCVWFHYAHVNLIIVQCLQIERVQNETLWKNYVNQKDYLERKNKHTNNEGCFSMAPALKTSIRSTIGVSTAATPGRTVEVPARIELRGHEFMNQ